jgi:hypothetical protein
MNYPRADRLAVVEIPFLYDGCAVTSHVEVFGLGTDIIAVNIVWET